MSALQLSRREASALLRAVRHELDGPVARPEILAKIAERLEPMAHPERAGLDALAAVGVTSGEARARGFIWENSRRLTAEGRRFLRDKDAVRPQAPPELGQDFGTCPGCGVYLSRPQTAEEIEAEIYPHLPDELEPCDFMGDHAVLCACGREIEDGGTSSAGECSVCAMVAELLADLRASAEPRRGVSLALTLEDYDQEIVDEAIKRKLVKLITPAVVNVRKPGSALQPGAPLLILTAKGRRGS